MIMNKNEIKDMAKLISFRTPALAKKYIVVASLKPRPPIDIGKSVMALITGTNTKKYIILIFTPSARAIK